MLCPPYGVCLPGRYLRALSGGVVQVRVGPSSTLCTVELADCACPELCDPGGLAARAAADALLTEAEQVRICLPLPEDPAVILAAMAADRRVSGHVFVSGDVTLTQHLIRRGLGERRSTR